MRPIDPRRAFVSALGAAVLAIGSLTAGAQAADMQVTFRAQPGSCLDGVSNKTITRLGLWDGPNEIDHVDNVVPDSHGRFEGCFSQPAAIVESGYRLEATDGTTTVQFTIPPLSLQIDRVTDRLSGFSRAHHALTIRVDDCSVTSGSKDCPRTVKRTVTTSGSGHYTTDLTSAYDLKGYDSVKVTYTGAHGDTYTLVQSAPFFEVTPGFASMLGQVNPGQHATFRLKSSPGGSVLSTRSIDGGAPLGNFDLVFSSSVTTGRQVTSDFASDARMTIPSTGTTFVIDHGDQLIKTRCLPNRRLIIHLSAPHGSVSRTAGSHGRVTVNLSSVEFDGFRLPHGSMVSTYCQTSAGDIVGYDVLVP